MEWPEVEGEIVQLLAMLIRFTSEGDQVIGAVPPKSVLDIKDAPSVPPDGKLKWFGPEIQEIIDGIKDTAIGLEYHPANMVEEARWTATTPGRKPRTWSLGPVNALKLVAAIEATESTLDELAQKAALFEATPSTNTINAR